MYITNLSISCQNKMRWSDTTDLVRHINSRRYLKPTTDKKKKKKEKKLSSSWMEWADQSINGRWWIWTPWWNSTKCHCTYYEDNKFCITYSDIPLLTRIFRGYIITAVIPVTVCEKRAECPPVSTILDPALIFMKLKPKIENSLLFNCTHKLPANRIVSRL